MLEPSQPPPKAMPSAKALPPRRRLLLGGPEALAVSKELARRMGRLPFDEALEEATGVIATRRASAEGQEGMRAFLERRSPSWAARSAS